LLEAVAFATEIGLPLRAHVTVMWSLTMAFNDHEGKRAARVREGLKKVLLRRGVPWAGVWVRECKAQTDITHDHLLFHLPLELCTVTAKQQLEASILRLVGHHGTGSRMAMQWISRSISTALMGAICSKVVDVRCGRHIGCLRRGVGCRVAYTANGVA
jgi:hypothetical protein